MTNLRADKNGRIVSIHSRLRWILDFVTEHPCNLEEPTIRKYVKEIAGLAGIRKHVKFHTAWHSFAMLLTKNGFHVEEVAELIGDDIRTAKTKWELGERVMDAMSRRSSLRWMASS